MQLRVALEDGSAKCLKASILLRSFSRPAAETREFKTVSKALAAFNSNLSLTAEFNSNPDQTHLSKLIKVFRISRN